jgi:hypothetical protein
LLVEEAIDLGLHGLLNEDVLLADIYLVEDLVHIGDFVGRQVEDGAGKEQGGDTDFEEMPLVESGYDRGDHGGGGIIYNGMEKKRTSKDEEQDTERRETGCRELRRCVGGRYNNDDVLVLRCATEGGGRHGEIKQDAGIVQRLDV